MEESIRILKTIDSLQKMKGFLTPKEQIVLNIFASPAHDNQMICNYIDNLSGNKWKINCGLFSGYDEWESKVKPLKNNFYVRILSNILLKSNGEFDMNGERFFLILQSNLTITIEWLQVHEYLRQLYSGNEKRIYKIIVVTQREIDANINNKKLLQLIGQINKSRYKFGYLYIAETEADEYIERNKLEMEKLIEHITEDYNKILKLSEADANNIEKYPFRPKHLLDAILVSGSSEPIIEDIQFNNKGKHIDIIRRSGKVNELREWVNKL